MDHETQIRRALEAYAAAWTAGDLAALVALYHDDFTLHYGGDHALSGVHVGKAAALAILAEFSRRTRRRLDAIVAVMAGPERGAIIARESFGDGAVQLDRVLVYAVRDGLLVDCWVYDADPRIVASFVGERS